MPSWLQPLPMAPGKEHPRGWKKTSCEGGDVQRLPFKSFKRDGKIKTTARATGCPGSRVWIEPCKKNWTHTEFTIQHATAQHLNVFFFSVHFGFFPQCTQCRSCGLQELGSIEENEQNIQSLSQVAGLKSRRVQIKTQRKGLNLHET